MPATSPWGLPIRQRIHALSGRCWRRRKPNTSIIQNSFRSALAGRSRPVANGRIVSVSLRTARISPADCQVTASRRDQAMAPEKSGAKLPTKRTSALSHRYSKLSNLETFAPIAISRQQHPLSWSLPIRLEGAPIHRRGRDEHVVYRDAIRRFQAGEHHDHAP
jgi:hypothetical protein